MTILGRHILDEHGPYVGFAVLDERPPIEEWQSLPRTEYEQGIFFELADSLLSCYCDITRSYAPFNPDGFALLNDPHQIYELSGKLLMWELQIAKAPARHFIPIPGRHELTEIGSSAHPAGQLK